MTIAEVEAAAKRLKFHSSLTAKVMEKRTLADVHSIVSTSPYYDTDKMSVSRKLRDEDIEIILSYAIESLGIKTETP